MVSRINSATAQLYAAIGSDPISRLRFRFARHRIILARTPTRMSLDEPITDSMPPERRRELLRPFYFAQVYERSDGSLVPPSGHRVTYFDAQGFERHEDSTRYTFWVDPSDGSWKHWRLRRFYPFETLVDLGIDEVLRQAGARVRV